MKIVYVTDDHSPSAGGIASIITQAARRMVAHGADVEILCSSSELIPPPNRVLVRKCPPRGPLAAWMGSPELSIAIKEAISPQPEMLVHIHGIWMAPQWLAAKAARANRIPFIVSDYGMLDPWFWNYKGARQLIRKRVYWRSFAYPAFRHARVIHASTLPHAALLPKLFPHKRIEVISPGIDTSAIDDFLSRKKHEGGRRGGYHRQILFIGRLDPQKGVDLLIRAFAAAQLPATWRLLVVGPERVPGYRRWLEQIARDEKILDQITFYGPAYGEEKYRLYSEAWVVAIPSRAEAPGMVNFEAAACFAPSITTVRTGLLDWEDGGGMLILAEVQSLARALREAVAWTESERIERGRRSRHHLEMKYSWEVVGQQWHQLYSELIGRDPR